METTPKIADAHVTLPAYTRPPFVSSVYRCAACIAVGSAAVAALAGVAASMSLAVGSALAISSFWALERTLAVNYGGSSGKGRWLSFGLAAAKYGVLGVALLVATRLDAFRMGFMATGLVAVYAGVVVTATRDMIRRNAVTGVGGGSGDMV